jgi:hypothetical protein
LGLLDPAPVNVEMGHPEPIRCAQGKLREEPALSIAEGISRSLKRILRCTQNDISPIPLLPLLRTFHLPTAVPPYRRTVFSAILPPSCLVF